MKKCTKCNTEKETTEFYKNKKHKDGLEYKCKSCKNQYNRINSVKIVERVRQWKLNNKEKHSEQGRRYYKKNKEKFIERQKRYRAKAKPCCYIYKHKNFFYVGSTKQHHSQRFSEHKAEAETKLGHYIQLYNLNRKDFELQTTYFDTIQEARAYEKELLIKHVGEPNCLNVRRS